MVLAVSISVAPSVATGLKGLAAPCTAIVETLPPTAVKDANLDLALAAPLSQLRDPVQHQPMLIQALSMLLVKPVSLPCMPDSYPMVG